MTIQHGPEDNAHYICESCWNLAYRTKIEPNFSTPFAIASEEYRECCFCESVTDRWTLIEFDQWRKPKCIPHSTVTI